MNIKIFNSDILKLLLIATICSVAVVIYLNGRQSEINGNPDFDNAVKIATASKELKKAGYSNIVITPEGVTYQKGKWEFENFPSR